MTDSAKLRIASLTKVYTAMNIMKLRENGELDLDGDISACWDEKMPTPITMRGLLTHTSQLADLSTEYPKTAEKTRELLGVNRLYLIGESGKTWRYNDFGFGLAGSTAEIATGRLLEDVGHECFLDSLGIDASYCSGSVKERDYALLYNSSGYLSMSAEELGDVKLRGEPGSNMDCFTGGLTICAKDYAKLIAILANDGQYGGTRYLSPETVEEMERPVIKVGDGAQAFTQCMPMRYKENIYGRSGLYYHTGNAFGVLSFASYDPETRCGVVILTTGARSDKDSNGIYAVCGSIADLL